MNIIPCTSLRITKNITEDYGHIGNKHITNYINMVLSYSCSCTESTEMNIN